MGTRRGSRAAAVAAALIGLGLVLHRPTHAPELRAGRRAAPASGERLHASAINWPAPAGPAPGPNGGALPGDAENAASSWRDAPADRPLTLGELAAVAYGAAAASARNEREPRNSPSSAATPRFDLRAGNMKYAVAGGRNAAATGARRAAGPGPAPATASRVPLAQGPAADVSDDTAEEEVVVVAAATPAAGRRAKKPARGKAVRARPPERWFPLFRPPRREAASAKVAAARRRIARKTRPLLLSKMLGPGALRPPSSSIFPPDLSSLKTRRPALTPDGSSVPARGYELGLLESRNPRALVPACRRRAPHWDGGRVWHDGQARGLIEDERWLWLWKEESRWWAVHEPGLPLLRHQDIWWSKQKGVWFALHDGELWSWRRFSDWDAEGLLRLKDGVELVYSADYAKVAVITTGAGAVLYDAATGAELGEWLEEEMPRRRPRAPDSLRLPSGI